MKKLGFLFGLIALHCTITLAGITHDTNLHHDYDEHTMKRLKEL